MAWTAPRTWTDGELVTAAIMNPHVRDNLLAVGPHLIVRKTSDQSVTSSTVLVNDTALLFAVAANEVWRWEQVILWNAATSGDLKWTYTWPAGATAIVQTVYPFDAAGSVPSIQNVITSGTALGLETQDVNLNITIFDGHITNAGTAGNVQFQWAQKISNGTATKVLTHSSLWAVKLA